jgi:hypothetical protein
MEYDWFSIHYLSVCFGNYTLDELNNTIGTTMSGCATDLSPGTHNFEAGKAFVPWTVGVGLSGISFLIFPLFPRKIPP